jgi:hypothetical protein
MSEIDCIKPATLGKFIVVLKCGHKIVYDSDVDPVAEYIYPHRLICLECTNKTAVENKASENKSEYTPPPAPFDYGNGKTIHFDNVSGILPGVDLNNDGTVNENGENILYNEWKPDEDEDNKC